MAHEHELSSQLSLEDLEAFFLLSPDLLAVVNANGYLMRSNSAFEQIFGKEATNGQLFEDWLQPDDRTTSLQYRKQVLQTHQPVSFRSRCHCCDDSWQWFEWTIGVQSRGESIDLYYLGRNVEQQQQAEQRLERSQKILSTQQQHLESSEQRFQAIFNQTFQFIGLLTPDGTLIEANETALAFGGVSADQVLNKPFWEAPWWQTSAEVNQQLQDAIAKAAQGVFIRYEVDVLGANETVATIDFSLKPWCDQDGNVIFLIPEGRDITERKTLERDLKQLNLDLEARVAQHTSDLQRYAEAIENMQDGFHLWHLENLEDASSFRLQLSNPAAERLLHVPNHQALGHLMHEVLPNLADTSVAETCRQAVLTAQKKDLGDVGYELANGEKRIFAVKIFPLEERSLGVLFEDVTTARRSRQQIVEQKERLRIIFERAGVGIARLDIAGQWIQANDKLCEILAYSREELFQKDFREITHPDDAAQDAIVYQALISGQTDTAAIEKRYVRKDGEPVWCSVAASIIYDQNQQPSYFIAFIDDITDRKASELTLQSQKDELAMSNLILAQTTANLEQRNRELDEFAYVTSHDLKAPLRAIANLATWLEEDLEGQLPPDNKEQLNLLQGRVHRMENLIDGLLEYSRVGRGNHRSESIDVNQLLQNIVDLLDPPPEFTIAIAPNLPTLQTTRPALTQVFSNLISNAIKHHDRTDGRVEIHHQRLDTGFHEFCVIDNGPGIDPAFHQKVFNIFQVLEARDTVENTGIGLAIVKKTIEAEGGTIGVESNQEQRGATFRFTWPA
ncbi:MAG: PAS domain S-box protein [Cyanobacteria bacterium P01_D01_bin.56]